MLGASLVGQRSGRFDESGKLVQISQPTTTMSILGGFIIIFGLFAFNLASYQSITGFGNGTVYGVITVNCMLAASSGSITAMFFNHFKEKEASGQWSLTTAIDGCLVGLVAISAGANSVYPYGAFVIGVVAGIVYVITKRMVVKWSVDDPLNAVAII
ncbi:putative ammonium transporter 1 [Corticium candelabrum]|uniref:putative ammonium transporter 1 n=1 Tax=Corticium candelabrum TaxID=121492 RepID=UPI002E25668A|nr:putative ammonium transporter 1 [Corticium candelabrum]